MTGRWLNLAGLALGVPLVLIIGLSAMLIIGRAIQISFGDPAVNEKHLVAKKTYLDSLTQSPRKKFNVVIILFDDLGWGDLSSYGNALIQTPNIDSLAAEGLMMTNFYSSSPVCTPSRAGLLTGRFPPRTRTDRHVFFPDQHIIGWGRRKG